MFFFFYSEKGFSLKGKNLLPMGANSFLLEYTPLQKSLAVFETKHEVTEVLSLIKIVKNLLRVTRLLKRTGYCERG